MQKLLWVFLSLLLLSSAYSAQDRGKPSTVKGNTSSTTPNSGDSFQLGSKSISVPLPTGFFNAFSKYDVIAQRFIATEAPNLETLAVHVPDEMNEMLKEGGDPSLSVYTKVSVSKSLKARDISEKDFASLTAQFEAQSSTLFDAAGPVIKSAVANIRKGLSELKGSDVPFDITQPKTLGYIDKTRNVFGAMYLANYKFGEEVTPLLFAASFVHVRQRVIFVYTYRKFSTEKDAEILRDFTKAWTAHIVAANP